MARPREPIALIQAKGKKNLTKAEIAERQASEVMPCTDEIEAPAYLTAAQKKTFDRLAGQLKKINIMGETDSDTLARYVVAQTAYEKAVKELRTAQRERPKDAGAAELIEWARLLDALDRRVERYFKQATAAARELGLTISSRCRLAVPVKDDAPKVNKFARFGEETEDGDEE